MSWREILGISTRALNTENNPQQLSTPSNDRGRKPVSKSKTTGSWREILAGTKKHRRSLITTQNTHNSQKEPQIGNCANTADSAHKQPIKTEHHFKEALASACLGLGITPCSVQKALGHDGINDWLSGDMSDAALQTFAESIVQIQQIDRGERPNTYNQKAKCQQCGDVWLWFEGTVLGCPWCWNRMENKPIPRPNTVRCGDCIYFKRNPNHPRLGHCQQGEPEALAGNWDTDQRTCHRFLPHPNKPQPTPS